jgi:multidrug resistance efflux pump
LQAEINRLQFELALENEKRPEGFDAKTQSLDKKPSGRSADSKEAFGTVSARLAELQSKIVNPQSELDRLTRQFWVTKEQVKANKYDLSASRYRQVDADAVYHEKPSVTLERLARLESVMMSEIEEIKKMMKDE